MVVMNEPGPSVYPGKLCGLQSPQLAYPENEHNSSYIKLL